MSQLYCLRQLLINERTGKCFSRSLLQETSKSNSAEEHLLCTVEPPRARLLEGDEIHELHSSGPDSEKLQVSMFRIIV